MRYLYLPFFFFYFIFTHLSAESSFSPHPEFEQRLSFLKDQVHKELKLLDFPPRPWLRSLHTTTGETIHDVIIVGGGQTGLTLAFALRREKVTNVLILDENKEGEEGPWLTYAHMQNLRTPKYTIGPDCDIPSLTCQSWFEAKYGENTWNTFDRIPRTIWAEYLKWYRQTLDLSVANETKVETLFWNEKEGCFEVLISTPSESRTVWCRKIVLAMGLQGSGEWAVPDFIKKNLSKTLYSSVYENVNYEALKGKKVAILGGGPCSFDTAILCKEKGAKEIHMFFKRPKLVNLHVFRWGEFVGFLKHFTDLPDEDKWKFIAKMYEIGQPPTPETVAKVRKMSDVFMHFDEQWVEAKEKEQQVLVTTQKNTLSFDFLLISTGWIADLSLRHELKNFYPSIALWSDRYVPSEHQNYPALLRMPYLGKYFEFTEKNLGEAPYLNSIFNCTGGALLSTGFSAGTGLTGMRYSIPKIVYGIVSQLFLEDSDYYYNTLETYSEILFEN